MKIWCWYLISLLRYPKLNKFLINCFYMLRGRNWRDKMFNFEFLKNGLRYQHQILTSCSPQLLPALYQIWRRLVPQIWISRQKRLKLQMVVVGPIFEPHPSNLVRIHSFLSCKNAEIFVLIFQVVSNLAKISVSIPSISWGVLASLTQSQF